MGAGEDDGVKRDDDDDDDEDEDEDDDDDEDEDDDDEEDEENTAWPGDTRRGAARKEGKRREG